MLISIAVDVAVPMAEPMLMVSHCRSCAHGQSQCTNSFILLLNTTYKCPTPMLCPFPLLWLCPLPLPSRCRCCALGRCRCRAIAEAVPMVNLNAQIHTFAKYNLQMPDTNAMPISIAVAVAVAMAEPLPKLCPWPMPRLSHCRSCAHG